MLRRIILISAYAFFGGAIVGVSSAALLAWQAGPSAPRPSVAPLATVPVTVVPNPYGATTFSNGSRYPAPVKVDLRNTEIAVGAREAFTQIRLSAPTANTVVVYVRCTWGNGAGPIRDETKAVIFRPGDPLLTSVSCPIQAAKSGSTIRFVQANVPDGADRGVGEAIAAVTRGTPSQKVGRQGFRPAYAFQPYGRMVYSSTGAGMKVSDAGGPGAWSTALFHGRVQPSNAETGYYGEWDLGGFSRRDADMIMSTRKLSKPIYRGSDSKPYPFLAAALSAHRMPEASFRYGSVEWVVRMPNRRNSWPALWLLPSSGWPPEIDVFEGFGYNSDWNFASTLSTNLHGGTPGKRSFTRPIMRLQMGDLGLRNTLDTEFHRFQARVEPGWITIFVDGIEAARYANPFRGTTWYPLMTVAVKAPLGSSYTDGSGAMQIRSIKVWKAE